MRKRKRRETKSFFGVELQKFKIEKFLEVVKRLKSISKNMTFIKLSFEKEKTDTRSFKNILKWLHFLHTMI
jgi:predicted AAA+ superfamily ATPase